MHGGPMDRTRGAVLAAMTGAALALAACGSVGPSEKAGGAPPSTTNPKLELAASGQAAATAAAVPAADAAMPAIFPQPSTGLELRGALPDLGATGVVRQLRGHAVGAADVRRFAAALGLAGTPVQDANGWTVQGARGTLSLFGSDGDTRVSYQQLIPGAITGSGSGGSGSGGSTTSGSIGVPPVGIVTNGGPIKVLPGSPPA